MGKDESSLRSAARPTGGAVTAQDSSNATTEINLSEITALRERNRQLEAENAILRERENTLARDGIEVLNVVIETLRQLQPGKETTRFFVETKTSTFEKPGFVRSRNSNKFIFVLKFGTFTPACLMFSSGVPARAASTSTGSIKKSAIKLRNSSVMVAENIRF